MTLVKKWCGKNPSVGHLRTFGGVAWEHMYDSYRNKLDGKSHACIMMGYSKESNVYWLFDPVKQQIIIRRNVIFKRTLQALSCWPPSSDRLHNDPSDIVSDTRSTIPLLSVSKSQSTSPLESTGSQSTLNEIVTFPNWFIERHNNTLIPCFPSWIVKTLEVVVSDVGDISFGLKTQSQKQRASVTLLTRVLETCDLKNYADAKGQPKWEQVMLT